MLPDRRSNPGRFFNEEKTMKKTLVPAVLLSLLAVGCARIDYLGKYYPPTANVDVFMKAEDVKQKHEQMGMITATMPDGVAFEQAQQQIMEKARSVGADAIILGSVETTNVGQSTYENKSAEVHGTKRGVAGHESGSSHTNIEREHVMKVPALKYQAP
jgi:hypothetical protein